MAKRNGGIIGPDNVPAGPLGAAGGVWRLEDAFNYQKAGTWPLVLGYQIPNSTRFNHNSSDYLNRTPASAGNRRTFTFSFWTKRSKDNSSYPVLFDNGADTNNRDSFFFNEGATDGILQFYCLSGGSGFMDLATNQSFRDFSAWYHIVLAVDTTQATASNRVKLYVNGSQVTAFQTAVYPSQNTDMNTNSTNPFRVGGSNSTTFYYDGYLSDYYFIDGQALTPSSFGQTDSTTGIWTPIAYTGTYGTNGFYLKFANSSSLGTDSSGNGNNFTVNNLTSIDQSYDSPTNNFATLNPLDINAMTLTEGNLASASVGATWKSARATFGISKGKWYWEMKATASASSYDAQIGVGLFSLAIASYPEWNNANPSVVYSAGDGSKWLNGVNSSYGASYTVGDIIGVAFDADNLTVTFYKNGTSQGTITTSWSVDTYAIQVAFYGRSGGTTSGSFNFGYPPFTISSGNADANGFGNFEYAVPSGYYALCSKNLALYG